MTLTKKKSRPITVGDEKYRWLVSSREEGFLTLIAEKEENRGSVIEVKIKSDINQFWVEFPNVEELDLKVVKPKDVELIIRQAKILGWVPDEKGKPYLFEFDGKQLLKTSR